MNALNMDVTTIIQPIAVPDAPATAVVPRADPQAIESPIESPTAAPAKTSKAQIVLMALGVITFMYFARPVLLPLFLACMGGMTLKPLIRWSSYCRIPPALSAALVLSLLVAIVVIGFIVFGRPAMAWVDNAPRHMTELRQRVQKFLPPGARFSEAAAAVHNLGATEAEKNEAQKKDPTVQVQVEDNRGPASIINWTGTFLAGLCETLVLLYLLLVSGDLFLQKLVHVMPTLSDKKRAVEISHEIQQNISNYLFTVTLINIGLGVAVSSGLYFR